MGDGGGLDEWLPLLMFRVTLGFYKCYFSSGPAVWVCVCVEAHYTQLGGKLLGTVDHQPWGKLNKCYIFFSDSPSWAVRASLLVSPDIVKYNLQQIL